MAGQATGNAPPASFYGALSSDHRTSAVAAALQLAPGFKAEVIRRFILRAGGFRPETLWGWPAGRLAREVVRYRLEKPVDEGLLLQVFYTKVEPAIQKDFLETAGVPHDAADIQSGVERPYATAEQVLTAALTIHERHGDDALAYLRCLQAHVNDGWPGLAEALTACEARSAPPEPLDAAEEAQPEPEQYLAATPTGELLVREPVLRMQAPGPGQLHLLDDVVTVALINAANGVDGALPAEAAQRLVAELVRVNGQRHHSWYAAGLYRSLFGDDGISPGAGESERARRWFLAGQIVGLVRANNLLAVTELYDAESLCQGLGDNGLGASGEAAPHVFSALWEAERFSDAVAFLKPEALLAPTDRIWKTVFPLASGLLSLRDWENARPAFDLLSTGLELLRSQGDDRLEWIRPTVQRRQAHCRRLAGEFQAACTILQPWIDAEDTEPAVRSMMLTDVAMMDAGFRELAEVGLPMDKGEADRIAAALDAVEEKLEGAIGFDPDGAAHARYLLGIKALLRTDATEARNHLERTVSSFRSQPDVYHRHGLLHRAELYLALAVCLDHDQAGAPARVRAAARQVIDSSVEELRIPGWMLEIVLTGIAMADQDLATELAEALLRDRPADVAEQFVSLATELAPVAKALAGMAFDADREMPRRLAAAHRAVSALIAHGDLEQADALLTLLFEHAMRAVGRREVLELLERRESLLVLREPEGLAWMEAQLRLAEGDTPAAIMIWHRLAQQGLAAETPWQRAEVAAIVERLEEIPEATEIATGLRERLSRAEENLGVPEPPQGSRTIHLLVVGGNEAQARYEASIREILKRDASHIVPTFITPGWGSNWGDTARDVIRRLEHADGMVLHYFMRTMFGRTVRRAAGQKPWRSVAGHGRDGILRGIYACAAAVEQNGSTS